MSLLPTIASLGSVLPQISADLTSQLTGWIGDHGVYAVFALMALDALLPVGGELIMLYAGVLAAGAIGQQHVVLFGMTLSDGLEAYVVIALCGALGYLAGSLIGWAIGMVGGRPFVERHGRWLHLPPESLDRAEKWFERHGRSAVFLGRITPVVRSFISIPAGVLEFPIAPYVLFSMLGSLIWCFAFAGAGWAVSGSWETFHNNFRYADYAVVAAILVIATVWAWRSTRRRRQQGA